MPKAVDHDMRRKEVVSLAAQLIARHGIGGISFKTIAEAAGASTAIVSHYFRNKRDLLQQTYRALLSASQDEQLAVVNRFDSSIFELAFILLPLREEMISAWRISIEFFAEALGDPMIRNEWEANLEAAARNYERLFERSIGRGDFPQSLNAHEAAQDLLALIRGIGTEVAVSQARWPADRQRQAVRRMLSGMGYSGPAHD